MAEATDHAYQQVASTLSRRLLDGILLLPPGADEPLYVTKPGDAIWMHLSEPTTLEDLVGALSSMYEVSLATLLADVESALDELVDAGVVAWPPISQ